jgi:lipopolysaccharide transport system ATP-binding protein
MPTAIKFENISKQYRLGVVSTQTLSHDLNRWWKMNIRGKEDPYLKIGEVNDRAHKGESEYVWALKDINFEVQQGDVLGIIGKNGAGKSTLLKILSKVTAPTTGTIKAAGRIASLLEVGTGFHPEMTGRENIYMNGAIMGMTKAEITRRFDEIVDFSGVERYIDTPAKRYSSGMTVRLGFAIAAHLEPEILVVDEVLAVGDAEFQKKAIGKMQDISKGQGRTVLFVSHNMEAIGSLCPHAISLKDGCVYDNGDTTTVISNYLHLNNTITSKEVANICLANGLFEVSDFKIYQDEIQDSVFFQDLPLKTRFNVINKTNGKCIVEFNIELKTVQGEPVACYGNEFQNFTISLLAGQRKSISAIIRELLLKQGHYYATIYFKISQNQIIHEMYLADAIKIVVNEASPLYFLKQDKKWKLFPAGRQHGFLSLKVDNFVENEI